MNKPIISTEAIKRGHKTQREKYGDGYSAEMSRRAKLSHLAQKEKYGDGLSEEMSRRRKFHTKDELKKGKL